MRNIRLLALAALITVTACDTIPNQSHFVSTAPEQLLDISSEVITVGLEGADSTDRLIEWINEEQPTRAELYCKGNNSNCALAEDILTQFDVPYTLYHDSRSETVLIYERIMARDCDNSFPPNHINPYNLPYRNIGCTVASNSLMMISDKQQIVAPALSGFQDADKLVTGAITTYREPSTDVTVFNQNLGQ